MSLWLLHLSWADTFVHKQLKFLTFSSILFSQTSRQASVPRSNRFCPYRGATSNQNYGLVIDKTDTEELNCTTKTKVLRRKRFWNLALAQAHPPSSQTSCTTGNGHKIWILQNIVKVKQDGKFRLGSPFQRFHTTVDADMPSICGTVDVLQFCVTSIHRTPCRQEVVR